MGAQIITTPSGERLVVLPEAEYRALVEDAEDRLALTEFRRRLAVGEEELIPAGVVDRLLSGENPVRVWREHRGLTARALAERAGIAQGYLSQIETGKREGTIETFRKLVSVLGVSIDDLVAHDPVAHDPVVNDPVVNDPAAHARPEHDASPRDEA